MRQHINYVGGLIANTVYNCSMGQKKKMKFKDFLIDYKDATKTDEERLAESFKQFEKQNPNKFKVLKNG